MRGKWKLVGMLLVACMLVMPMMPVESASQAYVETETESSSESGWGPTFLTLYPYVINDKCVGARTKAWVFGHYGDTVKLTLYWKNVELTTGDSWPDDDATKTWTKGFGYWYYILGATWTYNNEWVFESGDFKSKLWVDGELEDETGWKHFTKDSTST